MSRNTAAIRAGSEQALAVYQALRARPGTSLDEAADRLGLSAEERDRCRCELASLGLTAPEDPERPENPQHRKHPENPENPGGPAAPRAHTVVDPDVALLRLLRRERDRLQDRLASTSRAHTALEALAGPFLRAVHPEARNPFAHASLLKDEGLEPWTVHALWLMTGPTPNQYVDVTPVFDRKVEALRLHTSQTAHFDDLAGLLRDWLGEHARAGGLPAGRMAEAFQIVHID